jgi:hypothetical protein
MKHVTVKKDGAVYVGHFCGTDETLDPEVAGSLDDALDVLWFESREEAEEFGKGDFWHPDAIIFDIEELPDA